MGTPVPFAELQNSPKVLLRFIAQQAFSSMALPVFFQEELKSKEATEGETTTLHCRLSKAAPVEWWKGPRALQPGDKCQIRQDGPCAELVIRNLDAADSGDYTCACGGQKTTASLKVNVLPALFTKDLKDEEVTEGKDATLRCELNKTSAAVEWKKGHKTLKEGKKYKMRRDGSIAELVVQGVELTDSGSYTCVCGTQQTVASLEVNGKDRLVSSADCSVVWGQLPGLSQLCWVARMPSNHSQKEAISE
ncbi:Obscurin [Varanus komodoensis]|nr:Obscurin [Varanus komodoensis]